MTLANYFDKFVVTTKDIFCRREVCKNEQKWISKCNGFKNIRFKIFYWKKTLNALIEIISDELKNGGKVQLVGFGTFETRNRAARKGRNPQTGAEMKIPASTSPVFKAGKALKDIVNK